LENRDEANMKNKTILPIENLSFWERKEYFEQIDFLIVGAGIVGCSTAYHLRKKFPKSKIIIVERGILPNGASTKNAGFACFGGPVELSNDLKTQPSEIVWDTVEERFKGLIYLRELIGDSYMDFRQYGGWDIITYSQNGVASQIREQLPYLNKQLQNITGIKNVFSEDNKISEKFGFSGVETSFRIELEGQIDTAKMMKRYHQLLALLDVSILFGINVDAIEPKNGILHTSIGTIEATQIILTVNGFANQLLPDQDVLPARAQVMVTSPIENLPFRGTFHHDSGFYYFRNFGNRVLLGGGRNIDIQGETTTDMTTTKNIQNPLEEMLQQMILPKRNFSIDYRWSGIMGVGSSKYPIVKRINNKVSVGLRLGGIGVAIGTRVGQKLAELM